VICAAAFASLGGDASFLGLAGRDDYGEFMLRGMKELRVNTDRVRRTDRVRTGVTVNLIHQSTRTQVTYPGTIAEFSGADVEAKDFAGIDHIHFAGPYLQTNFRPHITRLLKLAQSLKITTSLDPQWDLTEKWEFMEQWLPLLSYLFVNEGEALSLSKAANLEEACKILQAKTACAILKAGKDGAMAIVNGKLERAAARAVKVVDTTGAGDCFDAGFLFATLVGSLPVVEALKFGCATGSRSCMFAGGVAHRSSCEEIVQFMKGQ
jgi:sugar/nucleoside kinase (ribokinase family)